MVDGITSVPTSSVTGNTAPQKNDGTANNSAATSFASQLAEAMKNEALLGGASLAGSTASSLAGTQSTMSSLGLNMLNSLGAGEDMSTSDLLLLICSMMSMGSSESSDSAGGIAGSSSSEMMLTLIMALLNKMGSSEAAGSEADGENAASVSEENAKEATDSSPPVTGYTEV